MSGSRDYINFINLENNTEGNERRQEALSNILENSTYLPSPVTYEDIDKSFREWVENKLYITYEGKELPTISLFVNQRFSEYSQTWSYTDEEKNILLNFKTITRDNNPSIGENQGGLWNIPGERYYTINSIKRLDDNGTEYLTKYKMRQPLCVDLNYKVSIITNSYKLINEFNTLINKAFAARQVYLFSKQHPMPMVIENISDESEYNINDRQFFTQSYQIRLMAYIITEDDFLVEETPLKYRIDFQCGMGGRKKASAEIIEGDIDNRSYYNKPITIIINYPSDAYVCKFTIDTNFNITSIKKENIKSLEYFKNNDNNVKMINKEIILLNKDEINIKIKKNNNDEISKLILLGYSPDVIYDKSKYRPESILDFNQFFDEYTIDVEKE